MTALGHTLPFPIREDATRLNMKALPGASAVSDSDDRARLLTAAIARGDEAAFAELYDRYHGRLFRFALALGHGNETLAHETVHSTFLTAAGKLRTIASEQHLWNWLASVARQHLGKSWRRQKRDDALLCMADVPEPIDVDASDRVLEERLDAALLAMAAEERRIIEWFYFDGLSHREIASQTGSTAKAVSSKLERARVKLRALLSRKDDHESGET